MSLSDNIRAIRIARGLTQVAVAEAIGATNATLSKIERGVRNVTVDELHALADVFAMPMEAIVEYDPARPVGALAPPEPVAIADERTAEQIRLLQELPDDERATVFKIVDQMLTNKRFREFFRENAAAA